MHNLRSSIRARAAGAPPRPLSLDERRAEAPTPASLPNGERRTGGQRRAERHKGVVERAALLYRGKKAMVAVANVSKGGVTIETGLTPEVGEIVLIELPGKPPVDARVRWLKPGRVGLALVA